MTARALAKLLGTFHNISYYAPEMKAFADVGLPEYWRAYMAYRSAPMGVVPASVVESTFYNFAPAQVRAGIPSAWSTTNPAQVMALRDRSLTTALHRAFAEEAQSPGHAAAIEKGDIEEAAIEEAAALALDGIRDVEAGARPLFAAHRDLPTPSDPLLRLWFGCTLWREHRGDGHNLALAAAEIDGIECHVLLAARGVGTKDVICKIRGWTPDEWDRAHDRLVARDLLHDDGSFTSAGKQLRDDIETHTDQLASPPRRALGQAQCERLVELMEPLVGQLISSGIVPGRWPPPKAPK